MSGDRVTQEWGRRVKRVEGGRVSGGGWPRGRGGERAGGGWAWWSVRVGGVGGYTREGGRGGGGAGGAAGSGRGRASGCGAGGWGESQRALVIVRAMSRIPYVRREELGPEGQQLWDGIVNGQSDLVLTAE